MAPTESIFARLGRNDGIADLVDDIVAAHMENPTIRARFLPYKEKPKELSTLKEHLCRFLAAGTGGPDTYEGRSMPEAHRGMNISVEEYIAALDDIMGVLEAHDIDEHTQKDILAIGYSLKDEIVGV